MIGIRLCPFSDIGGLVHQASEKLSMSTATIYRAAEGDELTIYKRGN